MLSRNDPLAWERKTLLRNPGNSVCLDGGLQFIAPDSLLGVGKWLQVLCCQRIPLN